MRNTIHSQAVIKILKQRGHATNYEIYNALKTSLPTLNLPSVHRITLRLVNEGLIGTAPQPSGVTLLDSNPNAHDHFYCISCGGIIDIQLQESVIKVIQKQIGQNIVRQGLLISGTCEKCQKLRL